MSLSILVRTLSLTEEKMQGGTVSQKLDAVDGTCWETRFYLSKMLFLILSLHIIEMHPDRRVS